MTDTKIIEDKTQQAIYLRGAAKRLKAAGLVAHHRHRAGRVCALGAFEPDGQAGFAEEICPLTLLALAESLPHEGRSHEVYKSTIIATWSNEIAMRTTPEEGAEKVAAKFIQVAEQLEAEASHSQ